MKMKRILSLALALILSVSLTAPAGAAETAAIMRLTKTTGTVSVSKSNGKAVSLRADMRLYNGYNVTTEAESYAWISLDSTKLIKVDASSSVEIRKNGSKLEVNVKSGSVFFDVSEKLSNDESLNISSSTMAVGIRGTSGWVRVTDQWVTQTCLLDGSSQCVVADPVTSQMKSAQISGGDTAQCVVYPQEQPGDKCDILLERQNTEGIPGYVLTELVQNVELCDKILDDSGLDVLADLAKAAGGDPSGRSPDGKSASLEVLGQAERRQSQEEAEKTQRQEEIDKRQDQQENHVSTENVWEQGRQPSEPSEPSVPSTPSTPSVPDTPSAYTVTFNANGGAVTPASAVTGTDGRLTSLPTPTREGYTFDGWYTAAEGGTQVSGAYVFTANTTIYAHWTAMPTYTVTFDANGGAVTPASAVTGTDGKLTALPTPTRTDYTFDGWYTAAEGGEQVASGQVFTANTTIYAHWTAMPTYTVTFNANGGAVTPASAVTGTDGKLTDLPTPTRENYTFDGWFTAAEGGEQVASGQVFTANTTIYAHWTIITRTVTFNSQGGSDVASVQVAHGGTVTRPTDPTRTGYTFGGWYKEAACENPWDFDTDTVTGAATLYAKWTAEAYAVTFDSQSGSTVASQNIDYGEKITEPAEPTRDGYTFGGWYKEAACENPWDFAADPVTGAVTLYAKWTLNQYTVTFNSKGGSAVTSATVGHGGKVTKPADPTLGGYSFDGWFKESGGTNAWNFESDTVTGDVTLYAKWTKIVITFNANGGTQSPTILETNEDGKLTSFPTEPTRTGYTFNGWYTAQTGGEEVTTDTPFTRSATVYAHWTLNQYTVTFNSQGGSDVASVQVAHGGKVTKPADPTRTGYTFDGWFKESGGTNAWNFDSDTVTGAVTLYAKWTPNQYTVTFDSQGGSPEPEEQQVDYGNKVTKPADPAQGVYKFGGWYQEAECTNPWAFDTPVTGDMTLYAKWTPVKVTFELNGGTSAAPASAEAGSDGAVTFPGNPSRSGASPNNNLPYIFAGWYDSAVGGAKIDTSTAKFTEDTTVYAHWTVNGWDWELTGDTLRVYGTNQKMDNYDDGDNLPPWDSDKAAIKNVVIEDGVTGIGDFAFNGCSGLANITIPNSVTSIGKCAFVDCSSLTGIRIPESVESIGTETFVRCTNLTTVNIPAKVTSIPSYMFYSCTSLETIAIPSQVTSIGGYVFSDCSALKSVVIPEGVTSIGADTFRSCSSLTTITIPVSVSDVAMWAFKDCSKLSDVYYTGTKDQWAALRTSAAIPILNSVLASSTVTIHCSDGIYSNS